MAAYIVAILEGFAVTFMLGFGVQSILKRADIDVPSPLGVDQETWEAAIHIPNDKTGMDALGHLERILFFASLWAGAHTVIAGWLGFKVASKWAVWQHIMKVPGNFPHQSSVDDLRIRNAWGTRLASKFLLGTLYNVVCALAGVAVGKLTLEVMRPTSIFSGGWLFP